MSPHRPNPRLQRTRIRAPLSRKPLGGLTVRGLAMLNLFLFAPVLLALDQSATVDERPGVADVYLWAVGPPDGPRLEYSVTPALFAKVPQWNAEKDPPPLPIARAISIARKSLVTDHPDWRESEIMLWTIQLQQARSADPPGRWFYVFTFYRMLKSEPLPQGDAMILVLMDGSVVKPKTVKGSIR